MFNNLLNIHDVPLLAEKMRQGQTRRILGRVFHGGNGGCWDHVEYPKKHWWDIPEVMERWNLMISGDRETDYFTYLFDRHLSGNRRLSALTLGCGTGHKELKLVGQYGFGRIDAYDLSRARIEHARENARESGCAADINYAVADVFTVDFPRGLYDIVIVEQSLHHFSPLETILRKIHDSLKPEGHFVFNEYVGPSRFQWTSTQLGAVNGILRRLPERYRVQWKSGTIKRKVHRPGRLGMMLYDATEAVDSGSILPLVEKTFDVVEVKGYGGNLLQLLFRDIAQNFLSGDGGTQECLSLCFEAEDEFLCRDDVTDDFVVGVCRRRDTSTDMMKEG